MISSEALRAVQVPDVTDTPDTPAAAASGLAGPAPWPLTSGSSGLPSKVQAEPAEELVASGLFAAQCPLQLRTSAQLA